MKTAGTSVEESFLRAGDSSTVCAGAADVHGSDTYDSQNNIYPGPDGLELNYFRQHHWPEAVRNELAEPLPDFRHITCSRNPWDTLVSWYWYERAGWEINQPPGSIDKGHLSETDTIELIQHKFYNAVTLASVVTGPRSAWIYDDLKIEPTTPLSALLYLSMVNSKFVDDEIDYYIRFERLSDDYQQLCWDLNIEYVPLKRRKTSHRRMKHLHYRDYYNDELRDLVAELFSPVIEKFGYEF